MAEMLRFFGRRKGKGIGASRQALLDELLPKIQLKLPARGKLKLDKLFDFQSKEMYLEIGFGGGEHLATVAKMYPKVGFIGAEPFLNGVSSLLAHLNGSHRFPKEDKGLEPDRSDNVRIWPDDIRLVFPKLSDEVFDKIFVLYPDPWPKARHAERRFINQENLPELYRLLRPKGRLIVATDVKGYADWTLEQMQIFKKFKQINKDVHVAPVNWVPTRYEQKGVQAGRQPIYFIFSKKVLDAGKKKD